MSEQLTVRLPTLHSGQVRAFKTPGRFKAIRCGRRWGKTALLTTIASNDAAKGKLFGFFAPDYKRLSPTFLECVQILQPIILRSSQTDGIIRTTTGGQIEFWTLEDDNAGRSRKYHRVAIDEAAFTKPNMGDIWERSIQPTLFDYSGSCIAASNTAGDDPDNWFWRICNQPKQGFTQYHAPTEDNPLLPMRMAGESIEAHAARRVAEFDALRLKTPPLVFAQEYGADFVDWSGAAFFALDKLLVDGVPPPMPTRVDAVYAIIDSATKTGREHDGTAVGYFGLNKYFPNTAPLTVLDWDLVQIEGALLENWLPSVFARLEELARITGSRAGSLGVFIEDKASGMILLQQARRKEWQVSAIDSKLTSVGKVERAMSVSGYVYEGKVKVCAPAYEKVTVHKDISRNHFMSQVLGFRVSDNDRNRQDDCLDVFCYGIALALGNSEGF